MTELFIKLKLSYDRVTKRLSAYRHADEYAKHRMVVNLIYLCFGLIYCAIYGFINDSFYHLKAFTIFAIINLVWIFYRHIKRKKRIKTNENPIEGIVKAN